MIVKRNRLLIDLAVLLVDQDQVPAFETQSEAWSAARRVSEALRSLGFDA